MATIRWCSIFPTPEGSSLWASLHRPQRCWSHRCDRQWGGSLHRSGDGWRTANSNDTSGSSNHLLPIHYCDQGERHHQVNYGLGQVSQVTRYDSGSTWSARLPEKKKRMQVDVSWCKSCEAQLGISPRFDAQLGISNCWGIHAWQARVACYFAYQMDGGMLGRESQLCAVRSVKHVKQSECWNFLPCLPHIYHIFTIYFP